MKTLVIAEKPSVAKDIARVLHSNKTTKNYIEGNQYVITWALGHLITLADPEAYDNKYKTWDLDHLPIIPEKSKLMVIKQTAHQYKAVYALIHRKDIIKIIIATDAGREGELVARWILEKAKNTKPVQRLWISSVTDKAIKEGFKNLKDGKQYLNLFACAVARAESDWIVGINATRALTTKYKAQLSCGRVQTPTLSIVQKKEDEIKNFQPQPFYKIQFTHKNAVFTWQNKSSDRTFDKDEAESILAMIKNKEATVTEINKKLKKVYAPGLYDLTTLQRDANRIFGYSAKETLSIMQKLYEQHKVLTYPRTDSKFLSKDIVETIPERLKAIRYGNYKSFAAVLLNKKIKADSNFVNDAKVSDHHAIIPTENPAVPADFTDREAKIFDLVVKRFLSVLYPPHEYEETTVTVTIDGTLFQATGKKIVSQGYREIYQNNDSYLEENKPMQTLGAYAKGDRIAPQGFKILKDQTKPPARFTEGTLLAAMENPIPYMDNKDKNLVKTLGETGGLGTVATRADIIDKLFSSAMLEKQGNAIFITSKGKQLLNLSPKDLRSPDLTAQWEQKLEKIAKGQLKKEIFLKEIKEYTSNVIQEIKTSESKYRHDNITGRKCPECGKYLLEIKGKKGVSLVCQDPACAYRKSVSLNTNARCPNCHKKLSLIGEGDNKKFVCICGHKESMKHFEERKKKESNALSKKEVSKYINKINKEEKSVNSAIADALSKIKFD